VPHDEPSHITFPLLDCKLIFGNWPWLLILELQNKPRSKPWCKLVVQVAPLEHNVCWISWHQSNNIGLFVVYILVSKYALLASRSLIMIQIMWSFYVGVIEKGGQLDSTKSKYTWSTTH